MRDGIYPKSRPKSKPNCLILLSPQIFLDIVEEAGLLCPAGIDDDLTDITLYVGCHGTRAVVVLVVALA